MRCFISSILIMVFFGTNVALAVEPNALCQPITVKALDKNMILPDVENSKNPQVYFFKNTSKHSVWLDHPSKRVSASAGWSVYLHPGNWAALNLNRQNFALSCAVIHPGKVDYLDCAKEILVCAPKQAQIKTTRKGTFWLAEDKSWDDLTKILAKKVAPPVKKLPISTKA